MAEYIDRQAALEECDWYANEFCECEYAIMPLKGALENLPAADVRPVVKAHWIDIWSKLDPDTSSEVQCSKCRRISDRPAGNFCKWCGADMRTTT